MKEIIEKWSERGMIVVKWQECTIIDMNAFWVEIANSSVYMDDIENLNTLLSEGGYTYKFDNLDIYKGVITLWFY